MNDTYVKGEKRLNFYQLLVICSVALFIISIVTLLVFKRDQDIKYLYQLPDFKLYYLAFIILLGLSGYYSLVGERTGLWFLTFTAYFLITLFYGSSEKTSHRNFASASIILISIITCTIPILQNQGIIFGPDQWRDLQITSFIVNEGTFESSLKSGYYSFIPLFNLINGVLTSVTGWQPMITFTIIQITYSIIIILAIYTIVEKLLKNREASFIALSIFLSTPRLANIQAIPAVASIAYGALLLVILLEFKTSLLYIMPIISFTTTVLHPIGVIPLLSIAVTIIVIGHLFIRYRLQTEYSSYISIFFIICFLITIVYWSLDTRVLMGIFNPFKRLLGILSSLEYSPSVYNPQYFESEFILFAYTWALPVALTGTYLMYYVMRERKTIHDIKKPDENIILTSSIVAILLIGVAFVSLILSPGASLERYMNTPAYFLMLFPSALILSKMKRTQSSAALLMVLLILSVNVYLGLSSPNRAPFENPTFGSYRSTYRGYIEANNLAGKMPSGIRVYEDNNLPIVEVANLRGYYVIRDQSYQTTRNVINDFKINNIDYTNKKIASSLIYLQINEIQSKELLMGPIDVLYSSGQNACLKISEIV